MEVIWFDGEKKYIEDFLALPKMLYGKKKILCKMKVKNGNF